MEQICLQEYIKRFTKLNNTPPMMDPLISDFGTLVNDKMIDNILEGKDTPVLRF